MSAFERQVAKMALKSLTVKTPEGTADAKNEDKKNKKGHKDKKHKRHKSSRGRSRHRSRSHGRRSHKSRSSRHRESSTYSSSDSSSKSCTSDPMEEDADSFLTSYKFQFYKRGALPDGTFSYSMLPIPFVKEVLHVLDPARCPAYTVTTEHIAPPVKGAI
jgi:hypothetical protein